jgi:transcriptional regulator with XRE-family HTH domain
MEPLGQKLQRARLAKKITLEEASRVTKIRATIAERMQRSASTIPHVTNFDDADITELEKIRQASKADLQKVARDWLSDGVYVLEVHPYPELKPVTSSLDRSKLPDTSAPPNERSSSR